MAREYVFMDEWDVDAPQEAVYDAVSDARTFPEWWTPVYKSVRGDEKTSRTTSSKGSFRTP